VVKTASQLLNSDSPLIYLAYYKLQQVLYVIRVIVIQKTRRTNPDNVRKENVTDILGVKWRNRKFRSEFGSEAATDKLGDVEC